METRKNRELGGQIGRYGRVGFGVIFVCGPIGQVLSVPLIGFLMDASGSFAVSLFGMGAFSVVAVVLAFTLRTR
jgi:hypothetical protein